MAAGKTGALLGASCALGAHAVAARSELTARLGAFGRSLGLAFQHIDDLLGIWGDPAVTGKPVYSDLQNRKKSLPVVAARFRFVRDGDRWKVAKAEYVPTYIDLAGPIRLVDLSTAPKSAQVTKALKDTDKYVLSLDADKAGLTRP